MTRFKEIFAAFKSCFLFTANERLIILLLMVLFLIGLGLRWRHLSREQTDPDLPGRAQAGTASRDEHPKSEINASRK